MKLAIGNDHGAVELKHVISNYVMSLGYEIENYGTNDKKRFDYPVSALNVSHAVVDGKCDLGILFCGTGIGMSIAANKVNGIRACVCSDPYSAIMSKKHNNANILCLGARVVGEELAKMIVEAWLKTEFEGGRHLKRVDMIMNIQDNQSLN